jgi:hypothetical protein
VKIRNNEGVIYRVNAGRVIWVPRPEFNLGETVETRSGTYRAGWIHARNWHFKEKRFYYYIELLDKAGEVKRHKRRYWAEELTSKDS